MPTFSPTRRPSPYAAYASHFTGGGQALSPLAHDFRTAMTETTPAGLYAAGLEHARNHDYGDQSYQGGLMTNFGATGIGSPRPNLDRTYMPKRTVGGAYGPPQGPLPFEQQHAGGSAYGSGHATPHAGEYDLMMRTFNPGGQHFGGTLPAQFQGRQTFLDGPMAPQGYANAGHLPAGRYVDPAKPWLGLKEISSGDGGARYTDQPNYRGTSVEAMAAAKARFLAAHPNDLSLEDRYHGAGLATPAERGQNRFARASEKADARRGRMGIGNPVDQFFRANPMAGLQYGMLAQQMGMQSQHEANAHERGLLHEQNLADSYGSKNTTARHTALGQLYGAIAQRVQAGQGTAQDHHTMRQIEAELMGMSPGGQAGAGGGRQAGGPQMTEQQRRAALTNPQAAERDLIAQGATPAQARQAVQQLNPQHGQPSWWDQMTNSPMGSAMYYPGYIPWGVSRLFGFNKPRQPVGVAPRHRGALAE